MIEDQGSVLRKFLDLLAEEEVGVKEKLTADGLGIVLRTAINELDWFMYNYTRQPEVTPAQHEQYYVMSPGITRLVALTLEIHPDFPFPALTFRRRNSPFREVLEVAAQLGFIQHGRRVADTTRTGFSRMSLSEAGRYEFILPSRLPDGGAIERDMDEHFRQETLRIRREMLESDQGRRLLKSIDDLLKENVFVFREHFIGYDADPLLDEYYFQTAWSDLRDTPGFDSFNELREFGGIRYLKYLLATAYLNSLCLKHEAFCGAIKQKHPEIQIEDILTISADREKFVASMCDALNLFGRDFQNYTTTSSEEVHRIYDVVTLNRRNVGLLDRPWAPLPCIIEFSNGGIIKFISGRYRQMEFVLESLKRSFPKEYDANQQYREGALQWALEGLLTDAFPGLDTRRNINLRKGGRDMTDIDLVVIDRQLGDLFLLQLKFQDRPGPDFRTEASKMGRFRDESARWLAAVDGWLKDADSQTIKATFRIPRDASINRIRKLIIGRHHAWPLRSSELDENTAYSTWHQLLNTVVLMKHKQGDFRTLNGLFAVIRKFIVDSPERYHENEEPVEYVLDRLKFSIRQEHNDRIVSPSSAATAGAPT